MSLPARTLARNILRAHRASSDAEVLAVALKTLASGQRDLAYELVRAPRRVLVTARVSDVRRFSVGMTTWSDVDCFGCFVAGVAWRTGRISDKEIALRVGEDLAALTPHRPARAQLTHAVLHGTVSLPSDVAMDDPGRG